MSAASPTLSVVIPVYNESEHIAETVLATVRALSGSGWAAPEILVVDDGSDVPVSEILAGRDYRVPVRVIRQENAGRFEARRAGIAAAQGEYVLLLDARVTLDADGPAFVAERVAAGEHAWNGHCMIANPDSPYSRFWNVMTHAAFAEYLDNPRTTSFGAEEYDRFPKGTGHFLAPRAWLLEAIADFQTHFADSRFVSDDTHLLRAIAERDRIHISPRFASVYRSRETLGPFLRHAMYRGTTFFDGFARPGTRFFGAVVLAFPLSLGGITLALRRPRLALAAPVGLSGVAAMVAARRRRPIAEIVAFAALLPPFAMAFAAGVWRGALLAARAKAVP